ncbi:S8 family serine peptidase [Spirillospora albida]|uniref:S8 family serine peptidase n=1 Tax=Spirillospora albida TaxID=58123 RepID=UPI000A0562C4|nr:S8 family serine peptidase [Spirillospora albida]
MLSTARPRAFAVALAAALTAAWLPFMPATAHADAVRERQRPILEALDIPDAWKITRGAGVTVAVVDSGVDPNQADLAGSVTTGPNMLAAIDRGTRPARLHGTGMASLIAGHGHGPGGEDGIIGMAPKARVLAVRVIAEREDPGYVRYRTSEAGEGAVARGIRYAADHGADVINLSLGKNDEVPAEREAIGYAIGKGVVVIAAVGNDGDKARLLDGDGFAPYSYPASYPGVIAVAATDPSHGRAPFSNRNYSVVVSAPGAGLPIAAPGGRYFLSSGTSDASAVVSGIAALIRAKYRKLAPALVGQALITSTRYSPNGGYDPAVGFGEVNAARALSAAGWLASGNPAPAGKAAARRFGPAEPEPVAVIEHPAWVTPLIVGVLLAGVGGALAAGAIAASLARRHPHRPAALPSPDGPPPPSAPPSPSGPPPQGGPPSPGGAWSPGGPPSPGGAGPTGRTFRG